MKKQLLVIQALSPLHAGIGHGVGAIELPIAREKSTHIPILPGSSIKGVLRSLDKGDLHLEAFGPETANASDHAGAIAFGDARLVFLPMRSVSGTFAWVSSPYLLQRLARDFSGKKLDIPAAVENDKAWVAAGASIKTGTKVILEDLDFTAEEKLTTDLIGKLADLLIDAESQDFFNKHVCLVSDTVMGLLMETGTELRTRIALNPNTKTVKDGALWQEESLPVESLLVAPVYISASLKEKGRSQDDIKGHLESLIKQQPALQFGGNASVGQGFCRLKLV